MQIEALAARAAHPDVVVLVDGNVARAKRVDLRVVEDALVLRGGDAAIGVGAAGVGPRADVVEAGGRVDDAVAVAVDALAVLDETDVDHAVAGAVRRPDVAVLVDSRARGIAWLTVGRGEVLADDRAGLGVDLDDRALRGDGDPDEVEAARRGVELQLVGRAVRDVDEVAFFKVVVECVDPEGVWSRIDDYGRLVERGELRVVAGQAQDVGAGRAETWRRTLVGRGWRT